ncbi:MAG: 30S ribosomal protein S9 [Candidatus Omnitrophica bacterium]|nr:30S ribosomal protein S9 [Candidatus Omnitrophota bacterium]
MEIDLPIQPEEPAATPPTVTPPAETPAVPAQRVQKPVPQPKRTDGQPATLFQGTGRRKESIARVRLTPGLGDIRVNSKSYETYFPMESLRLAVRQPLLVTHQLGKFDVSVIATGGGLVGQAGAVKLGIARALLKSDPALRASLREAGLLTRDPRAKERKKYGQKGARKRFQWTKR